MFSKTIVTVSLWLNCLITGLTGAFLAVYLARFIKLQNRGMRMIGPILLLTMMVINQFAYCY